MRWWQRHSLCRMTKRGCGGSVCCTQSVSSRSHGEDSQRGGGRGGWQEWREGVRDKVDTVTWEGEWETKGGWRVGQGENLYWGRRWLVFARVWSFTLFTPPVPVNYPLSSLFLSLHTYPLLNILILFLSPFSSSSFHPLKWHMSQRESYHWGKDSHICPCSLHKEKY